jgi:hypothetical protein
MSIPADFDLEKLRKTNPELAALYDSENQDIRREAQYYDHDNTDHYCDRTNWALGPEEEKAWKKRTHGNGFRTTPK